MFSTRPSKPIADSHGHANPASDSRCRLRRVYAQLCAGSLFVVLALALALESRAEQGAAAQQINARQAYNVKAVYLYNFGKYVQWPDSTFEQSQGVFVIGVVGEDPFAGALERIAQTKEVQNRSIVVRRWQSPKGCQPCHILFLSQTIPASEQAAAIDRFALESVLVVGEIPGFAERGGTLNFFFERGKVRFQLNLESARRHKLSVDAKLAQLAEIMESP